MKTISIPGSKSDTNRAIVIASLTNGTTTIRNISPGDDSMNLIRILRTLGVTIIEERNTLIIHGNGGNFAPFYGEINTGIGGTTTRYITSICALVPGEFVLTAERKMLERPMGELISALRNLGAPISDLAKEGYLPVKFSNNKPLRGGNVRMNGEVSSQFFTSLMMISPCLTSDLVIEVIGTQTSRSYIDMTIKTMRAFGVKVENAEYQKYSMTQVHQAYTPTTYDVEIDASGSSYFVAAAVLGKEPLLIEGLTLDSAQSDMRFPLIVEKMGAGIVWGKNNCTIFPPEKGLQGIEVDMVDMPDTAQTFAVIAAFANGDTKITGLHTLRIKETDRIAALENELKKMGIHTEVGPDWIIVHGGVPHEAVIETYDDHRMAMSFGVAKLRIPEIVIEHPEVVSKSFPNFWEVLKEIEG